MPGPEWQARWRRVLDKLMVVHDLADEQRLLQTLAQPERPLVLAFVNAHALNMAATDMGFAETLAAADLLLRDGSGMAILQRRLGQAPGLNLNGTDFIPRLLTAFNGRPVAFWGTREPYLGQAMQRCVAEFGVRSVSLQEGFSEVATYVELARAHQPALIVLGMGMPRQETVAAALAASAGPCVIVCGGAILDFLGGKVTRAPRWVRRFGCEWLYRLLREPKRLFTRYVLGNPLFLWRVLDYARAEAKRAGTG
ncbi:WecB/TagA/CpsF family glycosyltransferase [Pantoea sp. Cy-639]|uniref:WecB/TagA/CpsF family glycosyltransferase n=1 Tax=Pantoea sp. Cy-639 TaxID=2608360 RepID=UPI00141EF4DC|nr:WecB/TagA/CpsF family glycosyltransferase [Pantoea sp. Cy-639]NIF17805.1 WecB/TagA/CpsF family glycosyltransferase [Pantoea sp. Cy-639]